MGPESGNIEIKIDSGFIDLPFENDLDQDEFNRTHRKPGDPPYDPTAKWMDPPKSKSS